MSFIPEYNDTVFSEIYSPHLHQPYRKSFALAPPAKDFLYHKGLSTMNLYITEQGTSIRKQGNHLRLTKADKLVGDYLISEISSVNIVGAASISSDAMASLNDAGASVAFRYMFTTFCFVG